MLDVWLSVMSLQQACLYRPLSDHVLGFNGTVRPEVLRGIDNILIERLLLELSGFEAPPVPPQISPRDRFLNVSAMQKSIRRGDAPGAIRYALQGCTLDPDHIFRRLAVCAVEDVGIGNLLGVGMALAAAGNRSLRMGTTSSQLAAYLACTLASSPKSRLLCDLLSICDYDLSLRDLKHALAQSRVSSLTHLARDKVRPLPERVAAAWLLAGTARFRGVTMPKVNRPRHGFLQIASQVRMPLFLYYIADRTASRAADAMFISTLFAWEFLSDDPGITISVNEVPAGTMIKGFPSAAIDLHTKEGRFAISRFHRECGVLRRMLVGLSHSGRETAVRHAVFIGEGGRLSRQVRFEAADQVQCQAHRAELEFAGLNRTRHQGLLEAVIDNLSVLDQLRATVVDQPV